MRVFMILTLAVALVAGAATPLAGGETREVGRQAEAAGPPQPGVHHEHLRALEGDWTYSAKIWMPGMPEPAKSTGTMRGEMILGGRYLRTHWHGEFMGQPFEGIGLDGYDLGKQQYISDWRDNFETGVMRSTGHCSEAGKLRTTFGTIQDPATGAPALDRGTTRVLPDGSVMLESWRVSGNGSETKAMEIHVKRR